MTSAPSARTTSAISSPGAAVSNSRGQQHAGLRGAGVADRRREVLEVHVGRAELAAERRAPTRVRPVDDEAVDLFGRTRPACTRRSTPARRAARTRSRRSAPPRASCVSPGARHRSTNSLVALAPRGTPRPPACRRRRRRRGARRRRHRLRLRRRCRADRCGRRRRRRAWCRGPAAPGATPPEPSGPPRRSRRRACRCRGAARPGSRWRWSGPRRRGTWSRTRARRD